MSILMKQRIPALCALALGTATWTMGAASPPPVPGAAPAPAATLSPTNGAGAKIRFDTEVYDFGRVLAGEQVKHSFYFTNTGVEDLVLNNVRGSCSCTVVGRWARRSNRATTGRSPSC